MVILQIEKLLIRNQVDNTMTKVHAVFEVVKFQIQDENILWVDGRVFSIIEVGDTLYVCDDGGTPSFDFEVIEILHYSNSLLQTEPGDVARLVLKGNHDVSEILNPFDELFDLPEVS